MPLWSNRLGSVSHSTLLGNGNRITIEFAEALAPLVPLDGPHFLFASDGAAAVEQALRIALQFWTNQGVRGRTSYLAFGDAYHGDTIGALSVGAGGFGTEILDPLRFPVLRAPGFDDPTCIESACALVAEHAGALAAVVVEPIVQGAAGIRMLEPGAFAALRRACDAHDVLLICDEVATGFGRTGTLFASEQCDLRPDLMALGKGITGGYLAMAATVANERVFAAFLGRTSATNAVPRALLQRERSGLGGRPAAPGALGRVGGDRQRHRSRRAVGSAAGRAHGAPRRRSPACATQG